MDVTEAVEHIRAARPDLKKIIRVPEVGPLTNCRQIALLSLTFRQPPSLLLLRRAVESVISVKDSSHCPWSQTHLFA